MTALHRLHRLVLGLVLGLSSALADEPKNHDFDVILDESKVPPYVLPPLLVSESGKAITTPEEWFRIRRPEILALFGNLVYGTVDRKSTRLNSSHRT